MQAERCRLPGCSSRDIRRVLLQAVVDDDRTGTDACTRRLEGRGGGEGERVGPSAQRDEHERCPGRLLGVCSAARCSA
jgi:hypothetical protein